MSFNTAPRTSLRYGGSSSFLPWINILQFWTMGNSWAPWPTRLVTALENALSWLQALDGLGIRSAAIWGRLWDGVAQHRVISSLPWYCTLWSVYKAMGNGCKWCIYRWLPYTSMVSLKKMVITKMHFFTMAFSAPMAAARASSSSSARAEGRSAGKANGRAGTTSKPRHSDVLRIWSLCQTISLCLHQALFFAAPFFWITSVQISAKRNHGINRIQQSASARHLTSHPSRWCFRKSAWRAAPLRLVSLHFLSPGDWLNFGASK